MSPFGAYNMAGNVVGMDAPTTRRRAGWRPAARGATRPTCSRSTRRCLASTARTRSAFAVPTWPLAPLARLATRARRAIEINGRDPRLLGVEQGGPRQLGRPAIATRARRSTPASKRPQDTPSWTRERITLRRRGRRACHRVPLPAETRGEAAAGGVLRPGGDVDRGAVRCPTSIDDRRRRLHQGRPGRLRRGAEGIHRASQARRRRAADLQRPSSTSTRDQEPGHGPAPGPGLPRVAKDVDVEPRRVLRAERRRPDRPDLAAIEPRYRAVVLVGAGPAERVDESLGARTQSRQLRAPTSARRRSIVQGRYDEDTPLKTAAEPLFRLLPEPKRLVVYEGGHVPSVSE